MPDRTLGATRPASRISAVSARHRSREADIETQVQEELSAEIVALSNAVLALLQHQGYLEEPDVTEEVALEATEMILFAAMNCAHRIIEMKAQ